MTFGIGRGVAVDDAGNVQTNVWVDVRRMVPGFPHIVPLYADNAGVTTLDNPFFCETGEWEYYHVAGLDRVRVYKTGYDKTWDNVPVGTAQAADVDGYATAGFTWAPESATATPPSDGCIRFDNADVSVATHVYLDKQTLGGATITSWLSQLALGDWLLLSTGVGIEVGWPVLSVTVNTDYVDIAVDQTNYAGPAGPLSFGDSGFVTVARQEKGDIGISPGFAQTFSSTTTDSDPGSGTFRLNNATHASATAGYFDNNNSAGSAITAELDTWDDSTSTIRGFVRIVSQSEPAVFRLYSVSGSVVDGTGYRKVTLAYVAGNGTLSTGTACSIAFVRNGDKGDTGATGATGSAGSTGATGATGSQAGYKWTFNSSTSNADPGTGKLGFDNATLASAVALYISETDADSQALGPFLATWDDSSNTALRGTLRIEREGAPANFAVFSITAALTDNGTWDTFTVANVASGGTFSNGDTLRLSFSRSGDKGANGAGSGDLISTNNLSDVANPATARNNLGAISLGKSIAMALVFGG